MDILHNINKNIFVDINAHSSSNAINFNSAKNDNKKIGDLETSSGKIPSLSDLKKEQKVENEPKTFSSSNNLVNVKAKQKSKASLDPLSYSNYSASLKKISDPLSQMKPVSSFGYPTKNKKTTNTKKETTTQKETVPLKETNPLEKKEENKDNTKTEEKVQNPDNKETKNETAVPIQNNSNSNVENNIKITNTTLMNNIFGNYSNINLNNKNINQNINPVNDTNLNNVNNLSNANNQMMMMNMNYLYMMNNMNNMNNMANIATMPNMATIPTSTNMTNMTNMTTLQTPTNMAGIQTSTNMSTIPTSTNMANMTSIPSSTNMTAMPTSTNMTTIPTSTNMAGMTAVPNMGSMNNMNYQNTIAFNNKNMQMFNNNMNQQSKIPLNNQYRMASLNAPRNELNQVCKIGDLYSDTNLIREKCCLMKCEKIKDITKATFNVPDKKFMGVFVLTDFRLIFQIENDKYLTYNYPDDYFKLPLFSIAKIEKVQDKRMSYEAYPLEVTLKDTRVLKFHVYDQQRFYYNLSDVLNPKSPLVWRIFAEEYNQANFQGKNITNGWNVYDPMMEFCRQGVTEDNDLGLRYCYINKDFSVCPTYPKFLVEPKDMTDEELRQSASYRSKGRLPIFTYYYNGNSDKRNTPSIWRSAQNKRGIIGNKTSASDIKLLNTISKLGGQLFIYDCRPKINALVNRVNGGGYENVDHYDNVSIYFCEIDNIHKARKALNSLNSLCLSDKIKDCNNNFWTSFEASGWFQFIYLMLKNANEISKILQKNNSVLIHCSDGWDRTAQLSSLSQMLLDPFYRTVNGFAILVEKDWLSFGHQFGLRNGFADKEKQDQASPIFLQFLDAVHQLLEQFPNSFEFNEKFLIFLAKTYNLNLYGTFMFNNEKERYDANAKFNTASVWTEIFRDLKPYLNVYYDPNSVKILEPNYSYYNLKIWTALFMENNIYLENKHFYISDMDKNIAFKSKQEFFAYKKKEDENKYMDYQLKYEELLKVAADAYFVMKDNNEIFEKLSDESKKVIEELKPRLEKINTNKLKKKELLEKLKGKKDILSNETNEKEEEKKEEKETKEETQKEGVTEEPKENKNEEEKVVKADENIQEETKEEEKKEETKDEEKKVETTEEEKREENTEEKKEETDENREVKNETE